MPAYYNEIDPKAAAWLRELIRCGHIADGEVDERSIAEVQPDDLRGFTQCHFFAGIGGFSLALRYAGVADDAPFWTGGPPCQDASALARIHGEQSGIHGPRTGLAMVWLELIERCRPIRFVFENVPGFKKAGAPFFDRLGSLGYVVRKSERTARSVGAPHIRRRLLAFAKLDGTRLAECREEESPEAIQWTWPAPPGNIWRKDLAGAWRMDDGIPGRVDQLRAFGNAIVPQQVAEFIRAYLDVSKP